MAVRQDRIQLAIEINGVKAGTTYRQLINQGRNLNRELRNLVPGTDAFIRKSNELKKVNDQLANIRQTTKGVASGTSGLGGIFTKATIASIAFFAVERIKRWAEAFFRELPKAIVALESMQRKSAIVFGDAINLVEDYAAINAQSLGITEEAYIGLAATIGDILIPMGFQREEAAQQSTELVKLSGVLSEWSNGQRSAEEVAKILAKALTGERESLKELGIVITEADVNTRLLEKGQNKLTGSMLQQAKAVANYELILERSQDAQAAFARNLDGQERSTSRLSSAFGQLAEDFLRKLAPGLRALTSSIAESITPLKQQSDLARDNKEQFNALVRSLRDGNLTYEGRLKVINQINTQYEEYLPFLLTEKTTNEELQVVLSTVNEQMDIRIANMLKEEKLIEAARRLDAAKEEKDRIARDIARREQLNERLAERRAAGERGLIGGQSQTQAERNNTVLLEAARNDLKNANYELALAETHLLYVKNQNKDLDADLILGADAELKRKKEEADRIRAEAEAKKAEEAAAKAAAEEAAKRALARLNAEEERINKERELRINALDFLVLSEQEYASRREVINLESENKIAQAKIRYGQLTESQILALKRDVADNEIKIIEEKKDLELELSLEQINQERELRIRERQSEIEDQEDLAQEIKLITLEAERDTLATKLQYQQEGTSAYYELQNQITAKEQEIARERININTALTEEQINIERELALKVLDEMLLDEEDYQIARANLDAEYNIRILEARLKLYEEGSLERLETERKIREAKKGQGGFLVPGAVADSGETSSLEDAPDSENARRARQAALDASQQFANAQIRIARNRIDETLQLELDAIDAVERRKIEAAGDDQLLQRKIRAQAEQERLEAEKRAARERKKIARKEAVIQGALAVVEALPNAFAVAAAVAATVIQLAEIDSQSFYHGGYTPSKGLYTDKNGHEVAGAVHINEWVAPEDLVNDPITGPIIQRLERTRLAKRGFADGGYTTVSTVPPSFAASSVSSTGEFSDPETKELLRQMIMVMRAWPTRLEAYVSLTKLEAAEAELDYIRGLSQV